MPGADRGVYSKSRTLRDWAQPTPDRQAGTIGVGLFASLDAAPEHRLLQGSPHHADHDNPGSNAGSIQDVDAPHGQPHPTRVRVADDFPHRHGNLAARIRERNAFAFAFARNAHGDGNLRVFPNADTVCQCDHDGNSIRSAHVYSHTDTESNADVHRHSHVDAPANRDSHREPDTDFHSDPDRDGNANGHRAATFNRDADGHGYGDANGHAVADDDSHRYPGADTDRGTDSDSHGDPVSAIPTLKEAAVPTLVENGGLERSLWRCP